MKNVIPNTLSRNKSVLVSGASSGLGAHAVRYLAQQGFTVFAGVRSPENCVPPSSPDNVHYIPLDVTCQESIERAVQQIQQHNAPPLWGVVNNAGICIPSPLEMLPVSDLRNQLETNVIGQFAVTREVLPLLRAQRGRVVNVTSGLGSLALPYLGAYSMAQFAKEAFSDALRRELYSSGVDVIIIQPGAINTPIWDKFLSAGHEIMKQAPKALQAIYTRSFTQFLAASPENAQASPTHPEHFAHTVFRALTDIRPKTRYAVGKDSQDFRIKARSFPTRMVDRQFAAIAPKADEFSDERV
ncbi:SDR family oxidoreductase [Serratia ureilytica]|uniref:SDR family oxidoreductase n=1 Tax=Serratia ureilytica TaxID=300181 RepID=UPI001D18D7DC|nr:SDR family oxidoreductase [Serratia ureilytica]MCC4106504.1 SDR family oxidoreductase [Serratia ureilytica]